jgi:putative nucleotidyltransferase with HDIG domain
MSLQVSEIRKRRARLLTPRLRASAPLRIPTPALLAGVALWLASTLLVNSGRRVAYPGLVPGQIARATVLASVEFSAPDKAGTDLARDAAAAAVPPVFRVLSREEDLRTADLLLDELKRLRAAEGVPPAPTGETPPTEAAAEVGGVPEPTLAALAHSLRLLRLPLEARALADALPPARIEPFRHALRASVQEIQLEGVVAESDRDSRFQGKAARGRVVLLPATATTLAEGAERNLADLHTSESALARIRERLRVIVPEPEFLLLPLATAAVAPNLRFEAELTHRRQEEARRTVTPVQTVVRAGAPLVEAGKPVTPEMLANLRLHTERLKALEDANAMLARWAGSSSLLLAGLMSAGGLILLRRPRHLENARLLTLVVTLGLLPVALARLLVETSVNWSFFLPSSTLMYVLPYALAALLAAALIDSTTAFAVALWSSLSAAMVLDASLGVFVLGMASSVAAIFCAREMSRRTSLFRAGLIIGLLQMVFSVAVGWINQLGWQALAGQAVAGLLGGLLVAALALLLMPVFEYFGGMTSDIRLLEMSDLGHPLLEKLALDAPGTYHHSLMVAALSQAAANEVGANDLLVRVCAYFHDIGKMSKPEFFIENVPFRKNPHDELSPSMSTLVIVSHVKEGVSLALRYKLPPPILDAILQHHGTSVVRYFFERAKELHTAERAGAPAPGEEQFRYPGPKPQTLEMGILMLADTIEAASRTLEKPAPAAIERLVEELVADKIADGQLDECGMTFAQLGRIKRSFIVTLHNMAHGRIAYPRHEDRSGSSAAPSASGGGPVTETGRLAVRPRV